MPVEEPVPQKLTFTTNYHIETTTPWLLLNEARVLMDTAMCVK